MRLAWHSGEQDGKCETMSNPLEDLKRLFGEMEEEHEREILRLRSEITQLKLKLEEARRDREAPRQA